MEPPRIEMVCGVEYVLCGVLCGVCGVVFWLVQLSEERASEIHIRERLGGGPCPRWVLPPGGSCCLKPSGGAAGETV